VAAIRPGCTGSSLAIRLLGPFEVSLDGVPLSRLRYRKSPWLLALLALRHGAEVDREWLAGLLWPDGTGTQALRNSLTDLRRALGSEAGRLRSPTAHTVSLDLAGVEADVIAFDAAIARGDTPSLEEAIALYRGALLEGCTEEWASRSARCASRPTSALWRRWRPVPLGEGIPGWPSLTCAGRWRWTHCGRQRSGH
jgi:DNA-binding SARP family transcriptional activator